MKDSKIIDFWSSKSETFESNLYSSGSSIYPSEFAEVISKIETCSVTEIVSPCKHHKVLDVGAGGGRWTLAFADITHSVVAMEPSRIYRFLKERCAKFRNVTCLNQSFEEFVPDTLFDLVIISGILTYIEDEEEVKKFVQKATRLVEKQGYLILRELVAKRTRYNFDWTFTDKIDHQMLENSEYWEVIRKENYYVKLCTALGMKKVVSFPSHVPFFFDFNLPSKTATNYIRNLAESVICMPNFKYIYYYNKFFRKPYGFFRYLMNLRSMKILIFQRL